MSRQLSFSPNVSCCCCLLQLYVMERVVTFSSDKTSTHTDAHTHTLASLLHITSSFSHMHTVHLVHCMYGCDTCENVSPHYVPTATVDGSVVFGVCGSVSVCACVCGCVCMCVWWCLPTSFFVLVTTCFYRLYKRLEQKSICQHWNIVFTFVCVRVCVCVSEGRRWRMRRGDLGQVL